LQGESSEENSEPERLGSASQDRIIAAQPLVIAVDLFG